MLVAGPLDLHHQDSERIIGVYLLETDDGPALFDCGPATCVPQLRERLGEHGVDLGDVRHLLLSHIHLDHAGAAGVLVREHPGLRIHVSEVGAPHLVDPSRLERSARRLYGDAFDALWGELAPVPEANVQVTAETVLGLACFPTPGHASHHVCYVDGDGTLYAGDACGVRIHPGGYVAPVAPPPDVDVEAWERTIDEIERRAPSRLALIHFGLFADVAYHLGALRGELKAWSELVRDGAGEDAFAEAVRREIADTTDWDEPYYERAAPFWQSYQGLRRYWDKRGG